MSLTVGTRLGPYEILSPAGAGGMGEVYKARDTRLDRIVAIKVLSADIASDPELRERFEREARTISSLNHPHICTLYDVGEAPAPAGSSHQPSAISHDTVRFLVMEYLEGETLATCVGRGALKVSDAVKIAVEIADALDKAHRQNVVHRDVKPGNIFLTKSGSKLLDFGLAKVRSGAAGVAGQAGAGVARGFSPADLTSPLTMASPLTAQGTILGTFQYMSPEQIEGKDTDARSDIFAFGAVLYEMVTGRRAFAGKSQVSVMAAILEQDPPPIGSLQPMAPAVLDRIIRTTLAKDPEDRYQTARDLVRELKSVASERESAVSAASQSSVPQTQARASRTPWLVAAVALVTTAAIGAWAILHLRQEPAAPAVMRFAIPPPEKAAFSSNTSIAAVSPDGRRVAFLAQETGGPVRIWVRSLDSLKSGLLAGTDGANVPFWSPDSRYIGFRADEKLKKVAVTGGPPQVLCDFPGAGFGGAWNRDGIILFAPTNSGPVFRVSASGGVPVPATTLNPGRRETGHSYPVFLPDGRHFLYFAQPTRTVMIGTLDSTDVRSLVVTDSKAVFAPPGYLLFLRQDVLMAQPFDPQRLALGGEPVPVAQAVRSNSDGAGAFSVSDEGTLVFAGGGIGGASELAWFDREGRQLETAAARADWRGLNLSHDGRRIVAHRHEASPGGDLWIVDSARATTQRLTFHASHNDHGVWSPDDTRIVFSSNRDEGRPGLFQIATGASQDEALLKAPFPIWSTDWSQDGRFIVYQTVDPKTRSDVWLLPLDGDRKPVPYLRSEFNERNGQLSPDGRWMAYQSDESRIDQVYVQPVPPTGGKTQISSSGGGAPRWRRDGKELFFMTSDRRLMAADVRTTAGSFEAGSLRQLFQTRLTINGDEVQYSVSPDGLRFLIAAAPSENVETPITVVLNWAVGLKEK